MTRKTATVGSVAWPVHRVDLSIVVVTHNHTDVALATMASARRCTGDISVSWHVVDSGSHEPVADAIAARWPDVAVTRAENLGFAAANNRALADVPGRYLLLLNPDVEILSGTLEQLVAAMDARPAVGLAGVVQREPGGGLEFSIRREPTPARALIDALVPERLRRGAGEIVCDPAAYATERSADWLSGAFLVARATAAAEVGPLDERFFLYSEETDWCRRFRDAGWAVRHLPVMEVVHHRAAGSYSGPALAQLCQSRLQYARKHGGAGGMRAAIAARHLVRAAAFSAARCVRPAAGVRARAEVGALRVALGVAPAPFPRSVSGAPLSGGAGA